MVNRIIREISLLPMTSSDWLMVFQTCVQKEFGNENLIGEPWGVSTDQIMLLPKD